MAKRDLISTKEYAKIIGKSPQWVGQNKKEYGGKYYPGKGKGGKVLLFPRPESSPASSGTLDCVSPSMPVVAMPEAVGECSAPIIDRSESYSLEFYKYPEKKQNEALQKVEILNKWKVSDCSTVVFAKRMSLDYPLLKVNRKKLYEWRDKFEQEGVVGLINKSGNYAGKQHAVEPWMELFIIEQMKVAKVEFRSTEIWRALHREASEMRLISFNKFLSRKIKPLISRKAVDTFIAKYVEAHPLETFLWRRGQDLTANKYDMALGDSAEAALYPLHIVEIDASPMDVIVLRDGVKTRMALLQMVDLFTGRIVALIADTSNSISVSRLLKKFILKLGKPTIIRGDNGKEFVSNTFTQAVEALGIEYRNCNPYEHREKGTVERSFTYIQHQLFPRLSGYIGKNVAERSQLEAQTSKKERLSGQISSIETNYDHEELQLIVDEFLDNERDSTYHGRLGMTPLEKWNSDATERETISANVLDKLLGRRFERTIGKKGIRLENRVYISGEMGDYVGQTVTVIENMDTPSRLYCYQGDDLLFLAFDKEIMTQEEKIAAAAKAKKGARRKIAAAAKEKAKAQKISNDKTREYYATYGNKLSEEDKTALNRKAPTKAAKAETDHAANTKKADTQLERQQLADANPMLIPPRAKKPEKSPLEAWREFYFKEGGKAVGQ